MQLPKGIKNIWIKVEEWNTDLNKAYDGIKEPIRFLGFLASVVISGLILPENLWFALLAIFAVFRVVYLWPRIK
jgi:hypothetical protein